MTFFSLGDGRGQGAQNIIKFCMYIPLFLEPFSDPKIYVTITFVVQSYNCRSKTLQIGQIFDKTLVKQYVHVRVSNQIVIFFNKMR